MGKNWSLVARAKILSRQPELDYATASLFACKMLICQSSLSPCSCADTSTRLRNIHHVTPRESLVSQWHTFYCCCSNSRHIALGFVKRTWTQGWQGIVVPRTSLFCACAAFRQAASLSSDFACYFSRSRLAGELLKLKYNVVERGSIHEKRDVLTWCVIRSSARPPSPQLTAK